MKIAVVTGTSSGLGKAITEELLNNGWTVFALSRSAQPRTDNNKFIPICLDITKAIDVEDFFHTLQFYHGIKSIDLLVNNAGVFSNKEFTGETVSLIDYIIDTNIKGTMYVTRFAIEVMHPGSRIIFINSVAGLKELIGQAIYCASKAALTAFAGIIGQELRAKKIKVTSIHPGGINTPLWNKDNPYPPTSNAGDAMNTKEITDFIKLILSSDIEYKSVMMFPSVEWH